jgi:hypothetical protein
MREVAALLPLFQAAVLKVLAELEVVETAPIQQLLVLSIPVAVVVLVEALLAYRQALLAALAS